MEENLVLNIKKADGTDFHDLKLRKFNVSSTVMSLSDKIEGDIFYKDNNLQFTFFEYVEYKGIKYTLKLDNPPTIVKKGIADDNGELKGMTKYSLTFFHPMVTLYNLPFTDVAVDGSQSAYKSEDTTFFWSGTITELAAKINQCLMGTDFTCTMQEGFEDNISNSKIIQFSNQTIADALKTAYENFKVPFINDGYKILFGKPNNEILDSEGNPFIFKMGQGLGLKNNDRTPKNNKIITRIAGYGSEDNIPYGYPKIKWEGDQSWEYTINNNSTEDGSYPIIDGVIDGENVKLIKHPFTRTHLMPSIYVQTLDKKVNPYNPNYNKDTQLVDYYDAIDDESHKYITHINEDAPSYEKHEFADIKPTIEGVKYNGRPIDEFTAITPCDNDGKPMSNWIDTTDAEGKYVQSYFRVTLNPLGFDLYAMAAVTKAMSISMKTGATIACNFELAVDKDLFDSNFYVKNDNGDVIFTPNGVQRDLTRFPDSTNQSITITLQKDTTTYGTILPNVYQYPKVGDKFVFLGIEMPYTYILSVQAVLDEAMKQYMLENNAPLYDYPLDFDEYFLTTHKDILAQISTNSIIRFKYGDDTFMLSVKDYNISYGDKALPTYKITLSDDISITLSSIGQVTNGLSQLGSQVASLQALYGKNILQEIANKLSKVDNDVARGVITYLKGIKFGDYVSGSTGGAITIDKDGKTFAELDYLKVRLKAIFETLEIAHVQSIMGKFIVTPGGSQKITKVDKEKVSVKVFDENGQEIGEELHDVYKCYFLSEQDGVSVQNTFRVNDLLMSKGFNLKTIEPEPDDNFLGDFNDDYNEDYLKQRENTSSGSGNRYFWRRVVGVGEDFVYLSVMDCDTLSDAPMEGDTMCHVGNKYDTTRQNAIIISAVDNFSPSITLYQGINSYSFLEKEFVNIGVDSVTNKAFLNVYGSMYFGNRDLSSYIKYDEVSGVEIKGRLVTRSNQDVENVLNNYQDLIDGVKEIFYGEYEPTLENYPAVDWESDSDKVRHEGDVFTNLAPNQGQSWKWVNNNDVYSWELITDEDATKVYYEGAIGKRDAVNAKDAATALNNEIRTLRQTTNDAFEDGTISSDDAALINSQITQLNNKRDIVTSTYNAVLNNVLLDDILQNKTNLTIGYNGLINALNELTGIIQSYIADGTITQDEKLAINIKYDLLAVKYNDYVGYLNAANNYIQNKVKKINLMTLSEDIQSYEYIKEAIEKNTTTIDGGLILSSLLMLGYNDENKIFRVMSGINGIYDNPRTISAWYGGDMVDMFDYYNYTENKFENLPLSYAKGLDRMDGSGYRANGNLWWDVDGQVHADPLSFFVGEDSVGNLLYALFVINNPETGKPYYIQPNLPFYYAEFVDHIQIGKVKIVAADDNTLKVICADGSSANLYTTGGLSAYGSSTTSGGGGGGLITSVYGYNDLNNTFSDSTKTDTFNAYTIATLAQRISNVENSGVELTKDAIEAVLTENITTHTHNQYLTSLTSAQVTTALGYTPYNAANFTKSAIESVLTGNITSHTHSYVPLDGNSYLNGNLSPSYNNGYMLGSTNYRWSDVYATNGNFSGTLKQNGADVSVNGHTHTGYVSTDGNSSINGNLSPSYNNGFMLGSTNYRWSNIYAVNGNFSGTINSNAINPNANASYLLGSSSYRWSNIWSVAGDFRDFIQIGSAKLIYDSTNNAIKVEGSNGSIANFYATGGISAYGQGVVIDTFRLLKGTNTDGGVIHSILANSLNPCGLLTRTYTNNNVSLQVQQESSNTTFYNLILQPLGGNVGIGNLSPTQKLHVTGNILASGSVTQNSDIRLKSDIQPLKNRGYIQPCTYIKDGKKDIGFIAQDVQELYPELVYEGEYLSLNYSQITAILEAQIIELRKEIDNLKDKLNGI